MHQWLEENIRSLAKYEAICEELILVVEYFLRHPRPECFARSLPVRVESKFVENNEKVLSAWLDALLPDTAIDVNGNSFAQRYGLLEREQHRGIQLLDPKLVSETGLKFESFSLPIRELDTLRIESPNVFIVENEQILDTMPAFPRGIALFGSGNAAGLLERSRLIGSGQLYYWGDIDVEGLLILSQFRERFENVQSLLMNLDTLHAHSDLVIEGVGNQATVPRNLTPAEQELFLFCRDNNKRLEQEKLHQVYVERAMQELQRSVI